MLDWGQKEDEMSQLHKRFTVEQVKVLLHGYLQGTIMRAEVQEVLQISKTQFFKLLKEYRRDATGFSLQYERSRPAGWIGWRAFLERGTGRAAPAPHQDE